MTQEINETCSQLNLINTTVQKVHKRQKNESIIYALVFEMCRKKETGLDLSVGQHPKKN